MTMIPTDGKVQLDSREVYKRFKALWELLPVAMTRGHIGIEINAHLMVAVELQCKLAGIEDNDNIVRFLQYMIDEMTNESRKMMANKLTQN